MLLRGILGSGRTRSVSSQPFLSSSGWWWLISSVFLIRISCHKTTHANGYYGDWPRWAVSVSVFPLTVGPPCQLRDSQESSPTPHSSKASILQHSAFFIVQLSHPYMTTGKIIVLTRWTFVNKVMPLLFNMLSRLVITFLPRSKRLLIS